MNPTAALGLLVPVAYVIGSIPFGLLVGRAKGVDVRQVGSKNIGASNVGRVLGRRWFFVVFVLDAGKGLLPMLAASALAASARAAGVRPGPGLYGLWMAVGFAGILGHVFSLFLGFKGGKGVATTAGVLLGLYPFYTLPCLVIVAVFAVLLGTTRYISVGSIGGAVLFPVTYVGLGLALGWGPLGRQWPLTAFSVAVAVLVVWKHRANVDRLRRGTENRAFGRR